MRNSRSIIPHAVELIAGRAFVLRILPTCVRVMYGVRSNKVTVCKGTVVSGSHLLLFGYSAGRWGGQT